MDIDVHSGSELRIPFTRSDFKRSFLPSSRVNQKTFINSINYKNFINGQMYVLMLFPPSGEEFIFKVIPGPCNGSEVSCYLPESSGHSFENHIFKGLLIDNGKSVIMMNADPVTVSSHSLTVNLHKSGNIYHSRKTTRYEARDVTALIKQGDMKYTGSLNEFNPAGLRLNLNDIPLTRGSTDPIEIILSCAGKIVFLGTSSLIREYDQGITIVVKPINIPQTKYGGRKYRNPRLALVPGPRINFTHPFTGKSIFYDIVDISSSGFSVLVESDISQLMPGLIIDEAIIEISDGLRLKCSCQVVFEINQKKQTRYGFLITDMDFPSYSSLFNIVSRAHDPYARVSYDVDMESLWSFFFESGFIYPDKYSSISEYRNDFKKTFEKLYHHCQDIFADVTYQYNGNIYGHVSLVKAYERSWLLHHLAAKPFRRKITGLFVMNQMLNFLDGFSRMPKVGMDYLIFYYRPENRFPDFFFGGLARAFNKPSQLSLDIFAYFNFYMSQETSLLPQGWTIRESTEDDIYNLRVAYKQLSEGLMIDAFCLNTPKPALGSIEDLYRNHGLIRKCGVYTLLHKDKSQAYFIVDQSDRGMNLSDLINSVKTIIPCDSVITKDILQAGIHECGKVYGTKTIAVQVFPCDFMDKINFKYNKRYVMWTLDVNYFETYIEHIKGMAKFNRFKYIINMIAKLFKL